MDLRTVANVSGHLKKQYTKVKRKAIWHLKPEYTVHFELNGEDYWLPIMNGTKVSTNPSKSEKYINSRFTSEAKVQKYITNVKSKLNPSLSLSNDSNKEDYSGLTKRRLQLEDITNRITTNRFANVTMTDENLMKMRVTDIKAYAKQQGISLKGITRKRLMVDKIQEVTQPKATPEEVIQPQETPAEAAPVANQTNTKQRRTKTPVPKPIPPEPVMQAPAQPQAPNADNAQVISRANDVLAYFANRVPSDQGVSINLTTLKRLMVNPTKFDRINKIVSFLETKLPKDNSVAPEIQSDEQQANSSLQDQIDQVKEQTQKLEKQTVDITKNSLPVKEAQTTLTAQVDKYIDETEQVTYEKDVIKTRIRSNYTNLGSIRLPDAGLLTINCEIDPDSNMNDIFG